MPGRRESLTRLLFAPSTAHTAADQHSLYKRTLTVLLISQVFGGAGLAAGVTVGALLAQDMVGGVALAGLPAALFTFGSALAALIAGRVCQGAGRRPALSGGFLAGALGAVGVVVAACVNSPILLFASLFVYGSGTATNLQARYAGADLAPAQSRGTAVSIAMASTTIGAAAGPNCLDALGEVAQTFGIPVLAGPFVLAAVAYSLTGVILFVFLRPDPLIMAREIAHDRQIVAPSIAVQGERIEPGVGWPPGVATGATIMVLSQMAMVGIMTMTPVHMRHDHHSLGEVGFVIGMHVGAMFLPSLITGWLVDRVGRVPVAFASAVTLLAAGLIASFSPPDSMPLLTLALVMLGLGWNFGLISGTALIVDATIPETRGRIQGAVDVLIAIAGGGGGAISGVVVGVSNYDTLALGGGCLALLSIPAIVRSRD
jgi:MFS family permease